jgi:UDP-glucose 4-epimerase
MNRTVLVTGGCGYIGSHVARAFKQNCDTVHIVDQVYRNHTVKDIDGYMIADFASDEALAMIVNLAPDVVVHCAGTSLVGPSMTDPGEYYHNNIVKTIAMLNVIRHMPKRPVILFSSSASVYGVPDTWPTDEGSDIQPISPYGATKAMTERILDDYFKAYDIHSMCFRYFNAAGAEPINFDLGQEPGATHIVARALEASIANRAFTINGADYDTDDGTCVRDYVHVWDLAQAHILGVSYMLDDYPQPGAYVLNLGTREGISNKTIVDYVVNNYGIPFVNYGPNRPGDPDVLIADATQAKNLLGWEPKYSTIDIIINSAYKWYTKNNSK